MFGFGKKEENGDLVAMGQGESSINLNFRPDDIWYKIVDDPHDPGPMSCVPVDKECVEVSVRKHHHHFQIHFKWNVYGVKHIHWCVKS